MAYIRKTIEEMETDSIIRGRSETFDIVHQKNGYYIIRNLEKETYYKVYFDNDGFLYECSCPHYTYRHIKYCKHLVYVSDNTDKKLLL